MSPGKIMRSQRNSSMMNDPRTTFLGVTSLRQEVHSFKGVAMICAPFRGGDRLRPFDTKRQVLKGDSVDALYAL